MSGFLEAWDKRLFGHLMQRLLRASFMIINELRFRHLDRTGGGNCYLICSPSVTRGGVRGQ